MTDKDDQQDKSQTPDQSGYVDEKGEAIPFFKQKEEGTTKRKFKIGVPAFLGMLAITILLVSFTPIYSILMRVTPDSWQETILKDLYRSVPLAIQPQLFSEPVEMPIPKPGTLPVLGYDTGICFSFPATLEKPDNNFITSRQIERAKSGTPLAEIIVTSANDSNEYKMQSTYHKEILDKDNNVISVICQKFGRAYGSTPKTINALFIRPITPFKAEKTVWKSIKHLFDEYSSPLDPSGVRTLE